MKYALVFFAFILMESVVYAAPPRSPSEEFIALYETETDILRKSLLNAPIATTDKSWVERQHRMLRMKAEWLLSGQITAIHVDWLRIEFETLHGETAALLVQARLQRLTQVSKQVVLSR